MTDIATLSGSYFRTSGPNETTLVSTIDDPPSHRKGVMRQEGWGRSLGKESFNSVRPDGVEDEVVLLQGKIDDRFPLDALAGEYRLDLRAPTGGDEGGMIGVMNAFHDQINFNVPIYAPNLVSGSVAPSMLSSPNGRVQLAAQNDGNLVLYVDGVAVKALFGLPPDQLW